VTTSAQQLRARSDEILQLHEDGALEEALAACGSLLEDAEQLDVTDPVVRESLFAGRFELALLLTELGELEAAAEAYGQAARTPADLEDPDQRHEIAMALLNRGVCADAAGEPGAALTAYDELIERFGDADDPVTRDQVVRGRVNQAAALLALGRADETVAATQTLAAELDPGDALEAEQLAMTVRLEAAALRELDRPDEAVRVLAEAERCTDEDPAARSQVAAAHRARAVLLAALGHLDEAIDLLDRTVDRFRADPDPVVVGVVDELVDAEVELLASAGQTDRAEQVRALAKQGGAPA
jgi:tetratricopeptide (TPR) repeat protein